MGGGRGGRGAGARGRPRDPGTLVTERAVCGWMRAAGIFSPTVNRHITSPAAPTFRPPGPPARPAVGAGPPPQLRPLELLAKECVWRLSSNLEECTRGGLPAVVGPRYRVPWGRAGLRGRAGLGARSAVGGRSPKVAARRSQLSPRWEPRLEPPAPAPPAPWTPARHCLRPSLPPPLPAAARPAAPSAGRRRGRRSVPGPPEAPARGSRGPMLPRAPPGRRRA